MFKRLVIIFILAITLTTRVAEAVEWKMFCARLLEKIALFDRGDEPVSEHLYSKNLDGKRKFVLTLKIPYDLPRRFRFSFHLPSRINIEEIEFVDSDKQMYRISFGKADGWPAPEYADLRSLEGSPIMVGSFEVRPGDNNDRVVSVQMEPDDLVIMGRRVPRR